MNVRLIAFVLVEILTALLCIVAVRDTDWHTMVVFGFSAAFFAMCGVWLGVGNRSGPRRFAMSLVAAAGVCLLSLAQRYFNPWELLLCSTRLVIVGGFFLMVRSRLRVVIQRGGGGPEPSLLRVSIGQLLGMTVIFALLFSLMRVLSEGGGPAWSLIMPLLILFTAVVGLSGGLVSVVVAASLLSRPKRETYVVAVGAVLLLGCSMAAIGYLGTDSWATARQWFLMSLIEAMVVGISICGLRHGGYRLVRLSNGDSSK